MHGQAHTDVQFRQPWQRFGKPTHRPFRKTWGCQAASSPDGRPDRANTPKRSAQAEQAMESLAANGKIGSEYGEVGS